MYTVTCFSWVPSETGSSLDEYTRALTNSDLTLSPVGQNPECYRIYEAMAYGSVPIIEDKSTRGNCGTKDSNNVLRSTPLRLLKQYNAPVIYVDDWKELPTILQKEKRLTLDDLVRRRKNIIKWYSDFRDIMKDKFLWVIRKRFFGHEEDEK